MAEDHHQSPIDVILVRSGRSNLRMRKPEEWADLIAEGELTADTLVHVERQDGSSVSTRALDVPELRVLLAPKEAPTPPDPQAPSPSPEPVPEPVPEAIHEPTFAAAPETPPTGVPPTARTDALHPPATTPSAPPPRKPNVKWGRILILGLVALLLLRLCSLYPHRNGPALTTTAQTWYVTRSVKIRSSHGAVQGAELGRLHRGDAVEGVVEEGARSDGNYLRLTAGDHAGGYVWMMNLSKTAPPSLSGEQHEAQAQTDGSIRASPDNGAAVLEPIGKGMLLSIAGEVTGGSGAEPWFEIQRRKGGVGYAPAAILQKPAAAPPPPPPPAPAVEEAQPAEITVLSSASMPNTATVADGAGKTYPLSGVVASGSADNLATASRWLSEAIPLRCAPEGSGWKCITKDGRDVARVMAFSGFARADGDAYAADEAHARANGFGIWSPK